MKELVAATGGKAPGLAVVLVGARGDSETYVRSKVKACEEVGIESFASYLPEDVSQEELLKVSEEKGLFFLLFGDEEKKKGRAAAAEEKTRKKTRKSTLYISSRAPPRKPVFRRSFFETTLALWEDMLECDSEGKI